MARYIDADALLKHYKAMANIEWNKKVAPSSWVDAEAEKWFKECEELQGRMIDIKKEVAMDVLAELAKVGMNESRYPVIAEIRKKYIGRE